MEQSLDEFNRTKGKVVDDFKSIVNDAEALVQATAGVTGDKFAAERAKFSEKISLAKTKLVDAEKIVMERAKQAATVTDEYVHSNPWTAVGIAASVGMLIGFLAARR